MLPSVAVLGRYSQACVRKEVEELELAVHLSSAVLLAVFCYSSSFLSKPSCSCLYLRFPVRYLILRINLRVAQVTIGMISMCGDSVLLVLKQEEGSGSLARYS